MRPLRWLIPALVLAALAWAPGAQAQRAQPRIIAGTDVGISTYPFQIALYRSGNFRCGGSILDSTTVITAAHCVTTQVPGGPHVLLVGGFTVGYGSDSRAAQQAVAVDSVDVPPEYTAPVITRDESFDAAILTLSAPINLSANAQPIQLANPAQPKDTGTAVVTGWGNTSPGGSSSQTLKGTRVPLLAGQPCTNEFGSEYNAARAVCAGGGSLPANNPDTCQGDSGGPLVVDLDATAATNFALLGLTSFGHGCGAKDTPAVYTYVQGTGVAGFISASSFQTGTVTAGDFESGTPGARASTNPGSGSGSPPVPGVAQPFVPPAVPALRDTTRPTAKLSKLSCTKKRKCSFRIAAADKGGTVRKLSATVTRKVRTCKRRGDFRVCSTTTRKKTLKPKRISGGFVFSATLAKATYKLSSVATDAAGNRSKALSKTFRVR